jgi:hypothetical protein
MKKVLLALSLFAVVGTANAQWHHHGYYGYRGPCYGCGNWVAPMILGGVIGYEINRANQTPVIVQQPPVIVQSQPVIQQPPVGYHWEEMIDPATNTRKIVLVPN